eukprot:4317425-Pyramimonas_sp.AAC.1
MVARVIRETMTEAASSSSRYAKPKATEDEDHVQDPWQAAANASRNAAAQPGNEWSADQWKEWCE